MIRYLTVFMILVWLATYSCGADYNTTYWYTSIPGSWSGHYTEDNLQVQVQVPGSFSGKSGSVTFSATYIETDYGGGGGTGSFSLGSIGYTNGTPGANVLSYNYDTLNLSTAAGGQPNSGSDVTQVITVHSHWVDTALNGPDPAIPDQVIGTFSVARLNQVGSPTSNVVNTPIKVITWSPTNQSLPQQPLVISITNKDVVSRALVLENPQGTVVFQGSCGKGGVLNDTYDAPNVYTSVPSSAGVYTAGEGASVNSLSGYTLLAIVQAKLVKTPTDTTYSARWYTGPNFSIPNNHIYVTATSAANGANGTGPNGANAGNGNSGVNLGPAGSVTNNSGSTQTLQWVDAGGNAVGDPITVGPGQSVGLGTTGLVPPPGQTSDLTLTDSSGHSLGSVTLGGGATDGDTSPFIDGSVNATIGAPDPGNTTTSSNNNGGGNVPVGTTTADGNGGSRTLVNNGGSTTVTNQDIYNDVRSADQDAGQDTTAANFSGNFQGGAGPTLGTEVSDFQMKAGTLISNSSGARDNMGHGIAAWTAPALPTGLGSVSALTLPNIIQGGNITCDLTPFMSGITIFRLGCLFSISICGWMAATRIVRSAIS